MAGDWEILLGNEVCKVKGVTRVKAQWEAARQFKMKFHVPKEVSLGLVASQAKVRTSMEPSMSSEELVKWLLQVTGEVKK